MIDDEQQQFRALLDLMPQLVWMANADGYIFWYNRQWYEYTGTTPAQMEGWGWQSVHDPSSSLKCSRAGSVRSTTARSSRWNFPCAAPMECFAGS